MPQLRLMYIVRDSGPRSVGEIAERLNVRPATVTGLTDRLVRQKLIERQNDLADRRVVQIALTDEGRRVLGEIEVVSRAYFDAIFERMPESDVVQLISLLQKLADTAANMPTESQATA